MPAQVRLVVASPLDACASLTNPRAQLSGAVVLVAAAGPCALWRKARAVQAAGGAAVIFVNTPSAKNGGGAGSGGGGAQGAHRSRTEGSVGGCGLFHTGAAALPG